LPTTALPAEIVFQQLTRAFAASQNFSRHEVLRRQSVLLERLVRHSDAHVPFYRDSKRLKSLFRADGAFDLAGWSDVPLLTRNEAKSNEETLQARHTPADMGALQSRSTSGSTGTPLKFRQTSVQFIASEVLLNRVLRWHGLWPIQRVAVSTYDPTASSPTPGMLKVPAGTDFVKQVELLRQGRTTHVIITPSVAAAWADNATPQDLPDLTAVVATGEVLRPEVREKIERKLGVKVVNLYSTSELGPIASEGPEGRLRINEENVFLEEPTAAVDSRSLTRVVATPFYAFATPLIRYVPGDYVHFSLAKIREAEGLRRLEGVVGRRRNLLRQPDGASFLPVRFRTRVLETILDHREWQLVQTSLTDITLKIVVPTPPSSQQWDALQAYLKGSLPNHNTRALIVDKIENNMKSGKSFEMFLSLIDENE
jgi:phenylacetate-coenzyme A ligase PaaK-like adenylate-forming protein